MHVSECMFCACFMNACWWVHIICEWIFESVCMSVHVNECMFVSVCLWVYVDECMFVNACVSLQVYVYISANVYVHISLARVCDYMSVSIYSKGYVCEWYVWVHIDEFIFAMIALGLHFYAIMSDLVKCCPQFNF